MTWFGSAPEEIVRLLGRVLDGFKGVDIKTDPTPADLVTVACHILKSPIMAQQSRQFLARWINCYGSL
jgi:hypothetical protein